MKFDVTILEVTEKKVVFFFEDPLDFSIIQSEAKINLSLIESITQ